MRERTSLDTLRFSTIQTSPMLSRLPGWIGCCPPMRCLSAIHSTLSSCTTLLPSSTIPRDVHEKSSGQCSIQFLTYISVCCWFQLEFIQVSQSVSNNKNNNKI